MTQLLSGQSTQESWVSKGPRLLSITPGDWMLTIMLKKEEPGPVQSGQPPYSFQAPGCRATLSLSASQGNTSLAHKDTTWDETLPPPPRLVLTIQALGQGQDRAGDLILVFRAALCSLWKQLYGAPSSSPGTKEFICLSGFLPAEFPRPGPKR